MMKALAKFGRPSDFGTYRMIDIPEPELSLIHISEPTRP